MSSLLMFVAGFTWGVSVTILAVWGTGLADSFDEHWADAADLFEDDE
jgi:hypothetical protein